MRKFLIIVVLLLLAGCGPKGSTETDTVVADVTSSNKEINVVYSDSNSVVYEVKLTDGTTCAVFQAYKAGGISCGWERAK